MHPSTRSGYRPTQIPATVDTMALVDPATVAADSRPTTGLGALGPNWFATVMGTGIVATAAVGLPHQVTGQRGFALALWALAAVLLVVLTCATARQWLRHPATARAHAADPVMSQFYGAPPMALLTVGAGTLLVGKDVLGLPLALGVDWVLWTAGTVTGLVCAATVPYLAFTRHHYAPDAAFGGWLMPVVPPMVSATTGALLVPYVGPGQARETLLALCYALFGLSLFASLIVITLIWGRLTQHKIGAAAAVPTLWIVLGPLGQSVTAAGAMGIAAQVTLPAPYADGAASLALFFGLAAFGFALLWLTIATAVTVHTTRQGLPFTLTWWSFTFPVGTLVTGANALAERTGLDVLSWTAVVLYVVLLAAWVTVASRTTSGVLARRAAPPAGPVVTG